MTKLNDSLLFLPIDKEGKPDGRFNSSISRIRTGLGEQTINELINFYSQTSQLQKGYAKQGLAFAVAVFKEASYLHQHHRFDEDNPYGYKSKVLKKQAQQTLERIGFTKNNSHKLIATAEWLTDHVFGKEEEKWFESLTPSHLYELSRMSEEGLNLVKQQVSYPEFKFSAGQQDISVRRLEAIRRSYPKNVMPESRSQNTTHHQSKADQPVRVEKVHDFKTQSVSDMKRLQTATDTGEVSNIEMVEQFKTLAEAIDWSAIGECQASRVCLIEMAEILNFIADLARE